ncbi:hypothetical protein INT45_000057 [Circinella minor]|uniref:F-box domain-containing protein n=1 Tax=Circinella minor TaxID=1195481 RepID=A0A8H7RY20_9FUNG|nr:hypothetical protein INT45_000057 [Circinella minor]
MTKPIHIKTEKSSTNTGKSAKSTTKNNSNNKNKNNNNKNNDNDKSIIKTPLPIQFDIVISNANESFKAGRFDEAIDQAAPLLQELQEKAVRVLVLQAASWARKHKYQEELENAWAMINFAPKNPTGYLIVGRRYIDQGLQERAIEVFNKGLKSVSFSDSNYELLQDGKIRAQKKSKHRIDIVNLLPFDLVSSIMKYVDPETVAESTLVSKNWNQKLLNTHSCRQKIELFKRMQYIAPSPLANHGIEIARIARRLGRTPGATSARFSMIYRSYQGYGGTRPPSRLPLQRQE